MINARKYIGKRVGATIIDYTLIFILTFIYIYVFGESNEEGGKTVAGLPAFVPFVLWFLYFIVTETVCSGTLGHQLVGLKVVSLDTSKATFSQILKRRIADVIEISWCFGFVAFLIARGNDKSQRIGDFIGKTIVLAKSDSIGTPKFDFENQTE